MAAFKKAVVVDVILDSTSITEEYATLLKSEIASIRDLTIDPKNIPRNSLIVRSIHGNESQLSSLSQKELALPFFSPHICPPVKPGEVVWIFKYDSEEAIGQSSKGTSQLRKLQENEVRLTETQKESESSRTTFREPGIGYWMSRVSTFMQYDDINYTVFSRAYELNLGDVAEYPEGNDTENPPLGEYFRTAPNASNDPNVPSLFINGSGKPPQPNAIEPTDEFNKIFNNSTANGIFEFEPVPRFTKRPGDTVIQGSNNTLISLGVDRTGPIGILNTDESGLPFPILSGSDASKVEADFVNFAGTIDIVSGRGRLRPDKPEDDPESTSSRIINTDAVRGTEQDAPAVVENDKDPERSDREPNLNEGNPDFVLDSSRIYVSMRTNGDANFFPDNEMFEKMETANTPTSDEFFKDEALKPVPRVDKPEDAKGSPYIVVKSDEIRIIARQNEDLTENPDSDTKVNGSIRIIKEGTINDDLTGDRAAIIIHPDGTVQIDAPRIILGRNDVGTFDDGPPDPGDDKATGYVKFSQYNVQMSNLHDEVYTLANAVRKGFEICDSRWESLATTFTSQTNAPGFGLPVPGLVKAGGEILASWIPGLNLGLQIMPNSPAEIAGKVKDDIDADDVGLPGTGTSGLKSKIPEARSDTIFGE